MPYPTLDQLVAANPQWRSEIAKSQPKPAKVRPPLLSEEVKKARKQAANLKWRRNLKAKK